MNRVTIQEAKLLDQVDYLASLGFYPEKVRGQEFWYRSPLREEHTPSFKVDRVKGVWYDHGIGQGGTIIDFGIAYFRCDVREFLDRLRPYLSFHRPQFPVQVAAPSAVQSSISQAGEKKGIVVLSTGPLASLQLSRYLAERKIPFSIAAAHCKEVRFELSGRRFFAIGFKNDQGGFELRNAHFKGSSAPKASTFLDQGCHELAVFEGFFNFLSFLTLGQYRSLPNCNFLILNSLAYFHKNRSVMDQHAGVTLYLDRDAAGLQCTSQALKFGPQFRDGSHLYAGNNDLNEWLIQNFPKLKLEQSILPQAGRVLRDVQQPPPDISQSKKDKRI